MTKLTANCLLARDHNMALLSAENWSLVPEKRALVQFTPQVHVLKCMLIS